MNSSSAMEHLQKENYEPRSLHTELTSQIIREFLSYPYKNLLFLVATEQILLKTKHKI